MMTNALVIAGVDYFWQLLIIGVIVIISFAVNNFSEGKISISSFFQNKNFP
jgi:predicted ABC-type sugar transport system permease subunit